MIFNPTLEIEKKVIQKEGFLPEEIIVVKNETMPLQEMAYFNSLQNIRNKYTKQRSPSYRDFSSELGGGN